MKSIGYAWELLRAYLRPDEPSYLILFVTARCNARCKMCFYWEPIEQSASRRELSLPEIEAIARDLPHLLQVTLSGGEPFLRHDLADLIGAFVRFSGVRFVTIPTNAYFPERTEAMFEDILTRYPQVVFNLSLSLDGIGALHDEIRQLPQGFDKWQETFRRVAALRGRYRNFFLNVATVLSAYNQHAIQDIVEYVHRELPVDNYEVIYVRGDTKNPGAKAVALERYDRVRRWLEQHPLPQVRRPLGRWFTALNQLVMDKILLTETEDRMAAPCLAGRKLIVIGDEGVVKPCEILETKLHGQQRSWGFEDAQLGRLRDRQSLAQILRSPKARAIRRFITQTHCRCTFECGMYTNIVFQARMYPQLLLKYGRLWGHNGTAR